jgi:hypothetical protein
VASPHNNAISPKKRICPSDMRVMRLNVSRHCFGKKNGMMPSKSSINPSAMVHELFTANPCHFFGLVAAAPGPVLLKYLKNSEFGSTTNTSLRVLKLPRYASRLR